MHSTAFSPDGKRVVTASDDNTARIWDAESGKEIAVFKGHTKSVFERGVQPRWQAGGDGVWTTTRPASGMRDSGKEIAVFKGHTTSVFERGVQPRWQAGGDGV